MSSILDALKKVEQESAMDRGAGTPWPAPLPMQSPYRKRTRRWWLPLGIVVGLCLSGVVFWQVRQPEIKSPAGSMPAAPPRPLPNPGAPPHAAEAPKPGVSVADQSQTPPAKTLTDASPRQITGNEPASEVQVPDPMADATPVQPKKQPLRGAPPAAASRVQPLPSQQAQPLRQTAVPTSQPVVAPAEDPASRPAKTAMTSPVAAREIDKRFRSDPRIDLQAVVWAPESAARFVVINNRLIKEGGSVDNIVVVRINPDDVLMAEGSDRWYEVFKIR